MRPRVRRRIAALLLLGGGACLTTAGYQLVWTNLSGANASRTAVAGLDQAWGNRAAAVRKAAPLSPVEPADGTELPVPQLPRPQPGAPFAVLRIPRFGSGWARPVLEGTGRSELDRGTGHLPSTALPGAVGNAAVAGHRTTHGRPFWGIDRLVSGDVVDVETAEGIWRYRVTRHLVVSPGNTAVLGANPDPAVAPGGRWLTLSACTPRFSARQRWIVHARLTGFAPRERVARSAGAAGG